MKCSYLILASVSVLVLSSVSCGNRKAVNKTEIISKASIEAQKNVLADSILIICDELAKQYSSIPEAKMALDITLPEKEKLLKPTYLLDPEIARTFVTKQQKVSGMAILIVETVVRKAYDLPYDKSVAAITKLAAELNHPVDPEYAMDPSVPVSEKVRKTYEVCRERGELSYFWQFHFSITTAIEYIIANNPDIFFNNLTEEQWETVASRNETIISAIHELAKYDNEMNLLDEFIRSNMVTHNIAFDNEMFKTKDMARQSFIEYKPYFFDIRNNLLY